MDMKITWVDEFLHWHPDMFGGIEQIKYDGTVTWVPPGLVETSCAVDMRKFPFDTQKCEIRIGSWAPTKELVNISHINPINDIHGVVSTN